MNHIAIILKLFCSMLFLSLAACGNLDHSESSNVDAKPKTTIFDAQLDSLEKAKGVEQTLQNAVDQQQQEMEERGI